MAEPLRVLTYLNSLPVGGVEMVTMRLVRAWREQGVDARIALGRREGALSCLAADLPVFDLRGERAGARLENGWMIAKLPGVIRRFRPHILLCASNNHTVVAWAVRRLMGRDCPPIVLSISNDLVRHDMHPIAVRYDHWHLRLRGGTFAAVVAMVPAMQADIARLMNIPANRVDSILTASLTRQELDRLAGARDDHDRSRRQGRRFLGIGRLAPQKNFISLVDAFATIARPDDRLTIVGDGPCREAIERRAAGHGIADQLDLPGSQRDVGPWLATSDVFVLPSDYEGVPAVVIEALAAGIPIVATTCTVAMPSLVGGVGRLVPIRDTAALAAAMDAIGGDAADVSEMRRRAAMFTVEANARAWTGLFARLAAQRSLTA